MVLGLFKRPRPDERPATLYRLAVAAARQPALYEHFGVPDTIEGRIEMVMLHVGLVMSRLSADTNRELQRALSEAFFADMDASLREIGISDVAVPKKMKAIASAFYGRLKAYEAARGEAELVEALQRNVHAGTERPEVAALARYVRAFAAALAQSDADRLAAGTVPLPDASSFLDPET
jgi:cytochrome b pre-mRNA-processing protein 3